MKINSNTRIEGERVQLVPYRMEHVPVYHEWMLDPYLLEMTASEPLTIEEEYENQKSWYEDPKKCTFIIFDKLRNNVMCGDVNLFFNDDDPTIAQIEVMIAETESRKNGLGTESLLLMMKYGMFCAN